MNVRQLVARADPIREAYVEHGLATHAPAIAFRVLVAFVPLVLLGVALLGAFGLEDVWGNEIAPTLEERLQPRVFEAVDRIVESIMSRPTGGLIAFASALLLWETARGVRAVTRALNTIHGVEERRSPRRVALTTLWLSFAVGALLVAAAFVAIVGGRIDVVTSILRWPVAAVLLGVAVALLVRYAPAEQPAPKWASVGSGIIVSGWLLLSAAYAIWVRYVASYDTATGALLGFLVLTAYVLGVSAVFLIGVEVDETLRRGAPPTRTRGARSGRARSSSSPRRRRRSSSRRGS